MGRYEDALVDAERAISINPHLAAAYDVHALAYVGLGQNKEALTNASMAIELDAGYAMAYSNRAYINTGLGNYSQAVTDATKAMELEPEIASAYATGLKRHIWQATMNALYRIPPPPFDSITL